MTYDELCEAILTAQEEMLKCKVEANSVTLNGRKYGKLIENLPSNMKPTIFGMAVKADYSMPDNYDFIVQYEPPQPQTNADRIRQMSDEELAEWLDAVSKSWYDEGYTKDDESPLMSEYPATANEWISWLKAPVEEVQE